MDRQVGFGEGPIPFSSIDRYASRYGIDDIDDFDAFLSMIRDLDREYLKIRDEQRDQRDETDPPDRPVSSRPSPRA